MSTAFTTITYALASILSTSSAQTQPDYDVIIMGAGAAGIAAAKTLYEANITNILIIEAQWYVGGRTVVHHFTDYMLNIGASWISGACMNASNSNCSQYNEINPMLVAANKYNISYVLSDYEHGVTLDFGGAQHNATDTHNTFVKWSEASNCAWNIMANVSRANVNPSDMSFFAALYLCGWRKPLSAIDKSTQWLNFEFEAQHTKWSTASEFYDWDTYSAYGSDDLFITDPRGYQGIIKALANEFLDIENIANEERIILNSPITTIQYDENGVAVTLVNGTQYSANYGICTFSLGVLQSDIIEFIPKLPHWKRNAILAFDYVDYTIILVKWPRDFWSAQMVNSSEFIILNDERFGFFTWIYNFDHPNLYNGSLIWRFDISLDLAQTVQFESINDTITQIIDLKLSHYFTDIPRPEEVFVASWDNNRYVQGAYSNWPPGFSQESKDAMDWSLEQRLFFAGEAYSEYGYGYVHSAWLSGNATANEILACMGGYEECPSEYVPPSVADCAKKEEESVFKELIWLWIVFAIVFGSVLGYLFAKYCCRFNVQKQRGDGYGAVSGVDVPMVTHDTAQRT